MTPPVAGGLYPYDQAGALTGPARVLWADIAQAVPVDMYDVIPGVATAGGEYVAKTGWNDFGLAADAPQYSHDKDTSGLDYENVAGSLFEQISEIARSLTAQVAQIDAANVKLFENANTIQTIAAAAGKAAQDKVAIGSYRALRQYRIAMISYRPDGAVDIVEPAPSGRTRPAAVALILPRVSLAAEGTDLEWSRGDPVNAEVQFTAFPEPTLATGAEHGFWIFEKAGTIA